jgi:hypothetical protein
MDVSINYALLGKTLFEKCKTSQVTSEDISKRLTELRRWNQGKFDSDYDFSHTRNDKRYLNTLLEPINLNIPFDTPATSEEIKHFADVCGLTKDAVNVNDLFTYDWIEKATQYIDPKTNLQYLKVPKGAVLYHGMDIKYKFDVSRVPKYFGILTTAYPYGFVSLKNRRTLEQGKVIAFRLKEDILVLDVSVVENWKILIPTEDSAPKEIIESAEDCFNYKPNSSDKIVRSSTTKCDNIIYEYLLSLPQTSIASAAGARSQRRMTDEIVFTDSSKLEKVGYELPYEIVMLNVFDNEDSGMHCAFVIEARSNNDDRSFRLVTTLSEQDFREHPYIMSPDSGKPTFDDIPIKEAREMRKRCLQRALGNFKIEEF